MRSKRMKFQRRLSRLERYDWDRITFDKSWPIYGPPYPERRHTHARKRRRHSIQKMLDDFLRNSNQLQQSTTQNL